MIWHAVSWECIDKFWLNFTRIFVLHQLWNPIEFGEDRMKFTFAVRFLFNFSRFSIFLTFSDFWHTISREWIDGWNWQAYLRMINFESYWRWWRLDQIWDFIFDFFQLTLALDILTTDLDKNLKANFCVINVKTYWTLWKHSTSRVSLRKRPNQLAADFFTLFMTTVMTVLTKRPKWTVFCSRITRAQYSRSIHNPTQTILFFSYRTIPAVSTVNANIRKWVGQRSVTTRD